MFKYNTYLGFPSIEIFLKFYNNIKFFIKGGNSTEIDKKENCKYYIRLYLLRKRYKIILNYHNSTTIIQATWYFTFLNIGRVIDLEKKELVLVFNNGFGK